MAGSYGDTDGGVLRGLGERVSLCQSKTANQLNRISHPYQDICAILFKHDLDMHENSIPALVSVADGGEEIEAPAVLK
jgi:hypothetical protein